MREYGLELRKMVSSGKKAAAVKKRKTEMLATIYHMLSMTLGEPVKEFTYAFKNKAGKVVTPPRSTLRRSSTTRPWATSSTVRSSW